MSSSKLADQKIGERAGSRLSGLAARIDGVNFHRTDIPVGKHANQPSADEILTTATRQPHDAEPGDGTGEGALVLGDGESAAHANRGDPPVLVQRQNGRFP